MKFTPTKIKGVWIIDLEPQTDERGFFARSWCAEEFASRGLNPRLSQCSISFNERRGTLRGLHFQTPPYEEVKVVRCTRGAVYDVAVDLRKDSATFRQWVGVELTWENHRMVYIPEGVAHGFQTLVATTEMFYQVSEPFHPERARGVRWDDPAFRIQWPDKVLVISERDRSYRDFCF